MIVSVAPVSSVFLGNVYGLHLLRVWRRPMAHCCNGADNGLSHVNLSFHSVLIKALEGR